MEPCLVHPFKVKEIPRYRMSDNAVGLLLITYNDSQNLEKMLPSFEETVDYPTILHVIDMGSSDATLKILRDWSELQSNPKIYGVCLECWDSLESLTKTMNAGFINLMSRQECNFIGWIHPDMIFTPNWLSELVATLNCHPEIGKVCSFNTRDGLPQTEDFIEGQEQAYIVKRGVLLKVGLFDEKFIGIGGWEDEDLNARITQDGWKVVIAPKSKVWHKGMATRERRDTTEEQIHNTNVYRMKWGDNRRRY